ncbi:hypothetical protein KSF_004440 [Reticulibacter mediterranei]|uniref:Tetratricopeptide repeat protein n=1 Tax=Reticulibacter mediterranei TaxID=2778369 RepID=A0A8J3IIR0_9CHLR|nr:hypothetical protein KSF_004440 [Reticulibacter mediterranei]
MHRIGPFSTGLQKCLCCFGIELEPTVAQAYTFRGSAYRHLKKYQQALADFDRVIELDPQFVWAYARRGLVYERLAEYQRALANFDAAIALTPLAAHLYIYPR